MRALIVVGALVLAGAAAAGGPPDQVVLGRLLFSDKVLSGNRNIACGTCHHPDHGTADGRALSLGEGAAGFGPARAGDAAATRRNAPGLFNLGAGETALFHDGRVEMAAGGYRTPLGAALPAGLANLLAAQAAMPVLDAGEMAGQPGENPVADAVAAGRPALALDLVTARVAALPVYRARFAGVVGERPIGFADIANALAAFIAFEWRSEDSPYDRALAGAPLTGAAESGRALFYGAAGCGTCHSGRFQTDGGFHAAAARREDRGRAEVTGDVADAFAFRTPSLRNVALTSPYGHDGAVASLPAFLALHPAGAVWPDPAGREALYQFLLALTGDGAMAGRLGVPVAVPSGLPVDR